MKTALKAIAKTILPASVRAKPRNEVPAWFGLPRGEYHISHAQQAEDLHIQRYFGTRGHGFYVDIGADHPFQYSNTQLFYSRGWRGINIEPNPDQFVFFPQYRPQDTNLNLAVGNAGEALTYIIVSTHRQSTVSAKLMQMNGPVVKVFILPAPCKLQPCPWPIFWRNTCPKARPLIL
jgi:hypothetical protein